LFVHVLDDYVLFSSVRLEQNKNKDGNQDADCSNEFNAFNKEA